MKGRRSRLVVLVAATVVILAAWALTALREESPPNAELVVYCAHDSVYSEHVLSDFERRTGIRVSVRFDTEATKSLGLVNLLIREKEHPRCDVFWNNQVLGTMSLKEHSLLLPYEGAGYARIPDKYRDVDGCWAGFAGRLRVFIVNTDAMPATEAAIHAALDGDLSRMAVANPVFGTTLSHYSLLWNLWGPDKLKAWHADARRRGLKEVAGNATVKNLVAEGKCDFGWTDTDDFFVAADEGHLVQMLPIRVDGEKTICIPNSVAIIQGTRNLQAAQRLVDFLLSEEVELALARSRSRQIPLGEVDARQIPEDVRQLMIWSRDACDLRSLGPAQRECLSWLLSEHGS